MIDNEKNSKTIKIEMKPNTEMSYHSHSVRSEIWNIISGTGKVCINGEYKAVKAGDVIQIPVNTRHSIKAYEKIRHTRKWKLLKFNWVKLLKWMINQNILINSYITNNC